MKSLPFIYHGQSVDWLTREDHRLTVTLATEKAVNLSLMHL